MMATSRCHNLTDWNLCFLKTGRVRDEIIFGLPWLPIFGHPRCDSQILFIRDCATPENHWRIIPLVCDQKIVTHSKTYHSKRNILLYAIISDKHYLPDGDIWGGVCCIIQMFLLVFCAMQIILSQLLKFAWIISRCISRYWQPRIARFIFWGNLSARDMDVHWFRLVIIATSWIPTHSPGK